MSRFFICCFCLLLFSLSPLLLLALRKSNQNASAVLKNAKG